MLEKNEPQIGSEKTQEEDQKLATPAKQYQQEVSKELTELFKHVPPNKKISIL